MRRGMYYRDRFICNNGECGHWSDPDPELLKDAMRIRGVMRQSKNVNYQEE